MKIFLIVGKSFSGKDYLLNKILEDKNFCKKNKLERLVEGTTRKPREGEVDGVNYFFTNDDDFEKNYRRSKSVVYTNFKSEYGLLHYFIDKRKLNNDKNYIGVTNIETLEKIKHNESFKDIINVIYLIVPNYILFKRFSQRKENSEYDDDIKYKEIYRRFMEELIKYGKVSNRFLSGVRSCINVGEYLPINILEWVIENFLNNNDSNSIIMDENKYELFDYNYIPEGYQDINDTLDGKINIKNGSIVIDTEKEEFDMYF